MLARLSVMEESKEALCFQLLLDECAKAFSVLKDLFCLQNFSLKYIKNFTIFQVVFDAGCGLTCYVLER